jgi:hypothetical protein
VGADGRRKDAQRIGQDVGHDKIILAGQGFGRIGEIGDDAVALGVGVGCLDRLRIDIDAGDAAAPRRAAAIARMPEPQP